MISGRVVFIVWSGVCVAKLFGMSLAVAGGMFVGLEMSSNGMPVTLSWRPAVFLSFLGDFRPGPSCHAHREVVHCVWSAHVRKTWRVRRSDRVAESEKKFWTPRAFDCRTLGRASDRQRKFMVACSDDSG